MTCSSAKAAVSGQRHPEHEHPRAREEPQLVVAIQHHKNPTLRAFRALSFQAILLGTASFQAVQHVAAAAYPTKAASRPILSRAILLIH